jgi:uncharacterized phage-associated protein
MLLYLIEYNIYALKGSEEMPTEAMKVAKWFLQEKLDSPRNTYDGNMKLQKLLYFSQLIHLAKYDEVLFTDPICAYKNGSVVENVRLAYKNDIDSLVRDAFTASFEDLIKTQIDAMELTKEIFGHLSAKELSELNHLHSAWKKALESSEKCGFYYKEHSIINLNDIKNNELEIIKEMIQAHCITQERVHKYEVVNGIKFFYNPDEIELTEDVLDMLESFEGKEPSYCLYKDNDNDLVVY